MVDATEKLREFDGGTENYWWTVEVWRADVNALCNLRLRMRIYRRLSTVVKILTGTSRNQIHHKTEMTHKGDVQEDVRTMIDEAERLCSEYEEEREAVEAIDA